MADATSTITAIQALGSILLGGVLGSAGQGLRSIVEIKSANTTASTNPPSATNLYITSRLIYGLLVGFVVGVLTVLALGINNLIGIDPNSTSQPDSPFILIILAGYAGADAVDGLVTRFIPA
jgi:hypothetical protein